MKRFVSYLYSVYNNQKIHNAGFARMELRTGRNRVEIHLKENGYSGKTGTVYLFIRKQENIQGISIGNITFRNNQADFRFEQADDRIGQTPWQIMQMHGILIIMDERVAFLSQWDEQPVDTAKFQIWNNPQAGESTDRQQDITQKEDNKQQNIPQKEDNKQQNMPEKEDNKQQNMLQKEDNKQQNMINEEKQLQPGVRQTDRQHQNQNTEQQKGPQQNTQQNKIRQQPQQNGTRQQTQQNKVQQRNNQQEAVRQQQGSPQEAVRQQQGSPQKAVRQQQQNSQQAIQQQRNSQQNEVHTRIQQSEIQQQQNGRQQKAQQQLTQQNEIQKSVQQNEIPQQNTQQKESKQQMIQQKGNLEQNTQQRTNQQEQNTDLKKNQSEQEEAREQTDLKADSSALRTAELQPQPKNQWEQTWRYMLRTYPVLNQFAEENQVLCVRIEIKDVRLLPAKYWSMVNNSFLLHGFFNYRYLAFGRIGQNWFVGIPGIYQNQEHVMASIFGFPDFLPQKQKTERGEQPGYWYRMLEI